MVSFTLIAFSCSDDAPARRETKRLDPNQTIVGQLVGPDLGQCICCGGFLLKVPTENLDSVVYKFDIIPLDAQAFFANLQYPKDFPATVLVNYVANEDRSCYGSYVKLNSIKLF